MRQLRREIEIDAPPERMWAVVTDFAAYPEWNPFIRQISGELREGARLQVRIEPPATRATTFRPTVRAVEANRELRWLGRLFMPGIFDGSTASGSSRSRAAAAASSNRSVSPASSSVSSRARSRRRMPGSNR
jgi:hypothetical protein